MNELNMIFHSGSGCKASATVVTNVRTLLFVDLKNKQISLIFEQNFQVCVTVTFVKNMRELLFLETAIVGIPQKKIWKMTKLNTKKRLAY